MGEFMSSNDITRKTGMSASNQTFSVKFGNKSGGGGGTSDYEQLDNLPKIEGVTLIGNKSASDLGLALSSDIPDVSDFVTDSEMQTALADKADKSEIPTVPTNVSAFNNDSGYQTSDDVASAISGKADASDVYTKAQIDTMLIMDITNTIFGGE